LAPRRMFRLDADELWQSTGARSLGHWVAWKCGMSNAHAKDLVTTARRVSELPETMAGMADGVISEDQVAVIARKAPAGMDHHFAGLARDASVSQLHTALRIARQAQPPTRPLLVSSGGSPARFASTGASQRLVPTTR
jgi:Domain of unknown function (DUF222)